jgi:hypothetical protein
VRPANRKQTVLANQNAVPFLTYLYKNGPSKASYLQEIIKSYNSVKNVATALINEGLVSSKEIKEKNVCIVYELTELGENVAKKLIEAESLLTVADEIEEVTEQKLEDDFVKSHRRSVSDSLNIDQKD